MDYLEQQTKTYLSQLQSGFKHLKMVNVASKDKSIHGYDKLYDRPRGPMDKASDFESEDCGFEPHRGHL